MKGVVFTFQICRKSQTYFVLGVFNIPFLYENNIIFMDKFVTKIFQEGVEGQKGFR